MDIDKIHIGPFIGPIEVAKKTNHLIDAIASLDNLAKEQTDITANYIASELLKQDNKNLKIHDDLLKTQKILEIQSKQIDFLALKIKHLEEKLEKTNKRIAILEQKGGKRENKRKNLHSNRETLRNDGNDFRG